MILCVPVFLRTLVNIVKVKVNCVVWNQDATLDVLSIKKQLAINGWVKRQQLTNPENIYAPRYRRRSVICVLHI